MDIIEKKNPFQNTCKNNDEEEKTKMVGGYIPISLANRLRLLSIYYEKPLQTIIQQVLSEQVNSINKTDDEIIVELANRAAAEWNRRESENIMTQKQYLEYLAELEERLKKKKVSLDDIHSILTQIENTIAQDHEKIAQGWENEKN